MGSRKGLKKEVNERLGEIIELGYIELINNPKADQKNLEALIDQAADAADNLVNRINNHQGYSTRKEVKAHFKGIREDLSKAEESLLAKIAKG